MNFFIIVLSLSFACILFYAIIPWFAKIIMKNRFLRAMKEQTSLYITFDDGPDPSVTVPILQLLDKYNARATFFLMGTRAEKHPDIVRKIAEAGHDIGLHSYKHTHPWKTNPITSYLDIKQGSTAIRRITELNTVTLFRPPFGKLNVVTLFFILFRRYRVVFWDIDPKDFREESSEAVSSYVINRMCAGSVVLLHDGRRGAASNTAVTIHALEDILCACKERGVKLASIGQVFGKLSTKHGET